MNTTTREFMSYLRSLDIKLWAEEGRLRYSAPKGAMTSALRIQLKARKAELLSFLQQASTLQESGGTIQPVPRTGDMPLSFAQQRLWFMHYLEGGQSVAYNVPASRYIYKPVNIALLKQSLAEVVRRHETLRTSFPMVNDSPVQVIADHVNIELPVVNVFDSSEEEEIAAIDEWAGKLVNSPFDLENGPLLRVALLQFGEDESLLLAAMHHIISDGWSMEIFIREWTTLYDWMEKLNDADLVGLIPVPSTSKVRHLGTPAPSISLNGTNQVQRTKIKGGTAMATRPSSATRHLAYPLPKLEIQYADFAHWQRQWLSGSVLEEQLNYWTQQLAGAPPLLELPTDYARPPVQTGRGSTIFFEMSADLTQKLNTLSTLSQATLFMTVVAAFVAVFSRHSGQDSVVVGTLIANRNRTEIESLIGFFVNTLVLRINLSGDPTLEELLRRVRDVTLGAYAHQDMPFEELVRVLEPERNLSYNPLFQVMFVWQNVPSQQPRSPSNLSLDLAIGSGKESEHIIPTAFEEESGTAMFDLFITMWEEDQQIKGTLTYNSDLFEAETMARMGGHVSKVLDAMVTNPQQSVMALPLLTEAERHQLLVEWNETEVAYPKEKCFHQLFEEQVARTPEDVAVECENEPLTYWQLNRKANQLAHWLIKQGVGTDKIVALLAYRSINFLVAILAIFKAGGAYLPLDPLQPPSRISRILRQSEAPLVLSTIELAPLLVEILETWSPEKREPAGMSSESAGMPWPQLLFIEDSLRWPTGEKRIQNPPLRNTPNDLAYVIYTSGSTGLPKGAMVEHKGMLNHLLAKIRDLELRNIDIVAQNAPQSFDISVWQFLAGLLVGGQVNIFSDEAARDPNLLLKQVADQGVTILEVVPSLLAMMLEVVPKVRPDLSKLRWLIPTGEALPPQLCRQWLELYPHVPVINAYGPTECSDDVTHYPIYEPPAEEVFNIPIGRPIINTNLYILDPLLQPVPIGVAGELYVGGVGVGRGYLNDPERTQKAFMADPFALSLHAKARSSKGAKKKLLLESRFAASPDLPISTDKPRLYKTGDKARYLPDGNIEFLGRLDYQVKIRGFRIELGEIEAALAQHPMVYQNAVVARKDGRKSKRLVAYIVPNEEPAPTVSELRSFLKEKLPDYMVPALFVNLEALPLTHNGKVNRRDLQNRPLIGPALDEGFVPPRNPVELELVRIWQDLLDVHPIGVRDNFFDVGGHSLLAVRLMAQIEQRLGANLPLAALFQSPTIEELAIQINPEGQEIQPVNPFSCLVPIQPAGERAPFFAIHAIAGGVFSYMELSRQLGFEQPLYGIQAAGLSGEREPFNRIEDMAAHYIEAMQSVQPEGPYHLGGWSSGGVIAFEMAQQLHNAGHEVALLALIDSYASTEPMPEQKEIDLLAKMVEDLSELVDEAAPGASKQVNKQLTLEQQVQRLLEKANALNLLPPEITSQQMPYLFKVFTANNQAASYYTMQPYPGHITLFCASKVAINDITRGWSQYAQGGLELYQIPSDHFDIIEEPAVNLLAERLATCLQRASG